MATPRMTGRAAQLALRASALPGAQRLLRQTAFSTYRIGELMALGRRFRGSVPEHAMPLAGADSHMWEDQELGSPKALGHRTTSRALVEAFKSGVTSPSEVMETILARHGAGKFGEATFSPFIAVDEHRARAHAEAATARYRTGDARGPLDGVPLPVKDEHDLAGYVTCGGAAYTAEVAEADSFMVRTLTDGGALVFAKTHTTEWGMNPCGMNVHFEMPRNVYSSGHAAGGSSTGTGAAVALGLATVGSGSDGGGSIRIPSSIQGVFGIKPTFQRIGRTGNIYGSGTVSAVGPLGQSTTDLVDFLKVAARPDPNDYASRLAPDADWSASWEASLGRGVKGARIGVPTSEWQDADPRIARLCEEAVEALVERGAHRINIELPHADLSQSMGVMSIGPETMANLREDFEEHGELFSVELTLLMRTLKTLTADEYLTAQRTRAAYREAVARAFTQVDVVLMPTLPTLPPTYPVELNRVEVVDEQATRDMCRFAFTANLLGLPAGSVPVGMLDGLPVGLQVLGDAWDEASVLAVMAELERTGLPALPAPTDYLHLLGA